MKRFVLGFILVLLAIFLPGGISHASVSDFTIKDFQTDYYLAKDSEGRSTLKTVELITAEFPNYDQNHGIERAIPTKYDNHSVSLNVNSVTNEDGANLNYTTYSNNDNLVVRIGDANTYVHGVVTYKITYTQRDVTKYFSGTNDDEFYWDVNGVDWTQNFEQVSARVHLDPQIVSSLNSSLSCYFGVSGANDKCEITLTGDIITASVSNLKPYNNMTIAVGFKPNTFNRYQMSEVEKMAQLFFGLFIAAAVLLSILDVVLLIMLLVLKSKVNNGNRPVVPEYLPPDSVDVVLSSLVINNDRKWVAATYVDLAVRHKVKIIEHEGGFLKRKSYSLELQSTAGLSKSEKQTVDALFGAGSPVGTIHDFEPQKPDYALYALLKKVRSDSLDQAKAGGYYATDEKLKKKMKIIAWVMAITILVTWPVGIIMTIFAIILIVGTKTLSEKGLDLKYYLNGLEMYIKAAEEDRLKMLQSPEGAEKTPINTSDNAKVVRLYERVLPYAVLFGNEKEWVKVLGRFYEEQGQYPGWYVGQSAFNAAIFASAMSDFSTSSTANSYSSPSSSSSGGSGGGGSSGGGGGGGGGGGW